MSSTVHPLATPVVTFNRQPASDTSADDTSHHDGRSVSIIKEVSMWLKLAYCSLNYDPTYTWVFATDTHEHMSDGHNKRLGWSLWMASAHTIYYCPRTTKAASSLSNLLLVFIHHQRYQWHLLRLTATMISPSLAPESSSCLPFAWLASPSL